MKQLKIITCIVFFFTANAFNAAEAAPVKDSIYATYHYINESQADTLLVHFYKNKTYKLSVHGDHYDYYSKGTWTKKGRNIVVSSNVQKKEIPITITQSHTNNASPYIQIDDIRNSTNFLFKDIEILINNNDSAKSCLANVGSNCKIKKEDLKSIRIRLVGNTTSAWHPVELTGKNNTLKIVVDIDFIPEFYLFYSNKKFVKKWGKLYDPDMNVNYTKGDVKRVKK
jgi:hypothetical protein